ncbi:MAG: DMT family transporter [Methanomicrobiales archaeon]|nr:DMT family transporter [Methanomicrobiales archaeon]
MIWFFAALLGALCQACYSTGVKKWVHSAPTPLFAGATYTIGALILLIVSVVHGIPTPGSSFMGAVVVTVAINLLATHLFFSSLRTTDLSFSIPMLAFTPVFLLLTSALILGEEASLAGVAGIGAVVVGAFMITAPGGMALGSWTSYLPHLMLEKGVQKMLLVAFLFSISVNYDKIIVMESDPTFGPAVVLLSLGLILILSHSVMVRYGPGMGGSSLPPLPVTVVLGVFLAVEAFAVNYAYTLTLASYVIAIKRQSIVFAVLAGGLLLGEENLKRRLTGSAIMVVGAVMMVLAPS